MKPLLVIAVLALTSGVRMETCPTAEDILPCECFVHYGGGIVVTCSNETLNDKSTLKETLSRLSGKQNVHLMLESLALGRVPSDLFSGLDITNLEIAYCQLDTLSDGGPALEGLEDTLEDLTIIRSFTEDNVPAKLSVPHLRRLKRLALYFNVITELGDDWFQGGPTSLEDLVIDENGIVEIGSNAFSDLVNLKYFRLNGNRFPQIERSMLPRPASKLQLLNLQDNKALTEFPEDLFTAMPALTDLQIQRSGISSLDERLLSPVWQQLEWIALIGNPIQCDDHMSWLFNLDGPRILSGECGSPEELRGESLKNFIESRRQ